MCDTWRVMQVILFCYTRRAKVLTKHSNTVVLSQTYMSYCLRERRFTIKTNAFLTTASAFCFFTGSCSNLEQSDVELADSDKLILSLFPIIIVGEKRVS